MVKERKKSPEKSKVASTRIRDEDGHFMSEEEAKEYLERHRRTAKLFTDRAHNAKDDDTLLDVHVGNPLHKITKLIEDLKKQKAFAFTFKGSLGIMGVFLTLSVFGVLGGGQVLCDKGVQTHIGTIRTLQYTEQESKPIPFFQDMMDYFNPKTERNRMVLIKSDYSVVKLPYSRFVELGQYNDKVVMVTGDFDSCSQKLTVKKSNGIEVFQ